MTNNADPVAIIKAHQNAIWRYLRLLGCAESEADDLTQETFVVFLSKPFLHVSDAATFAYLRNTARYAFLAHARKSARFKYLSDLDDGDAVWELYEGSDDAAAFKDALNKCLKLLPERSRTVLELQYRDQATGTQIAAALSLSLTNVKSIAHRATIFLRKCIGERMSHE